jgi:nickel-type superoxide dismutase maturation protease
VTSRALLTWMVVTMAVVLAVVLTTGAIVAAPWVVAGRSMEPALFPGDRVLVDTWTYRHRPPRVGEVALLLGPSGVPMVKRVASPPNSLDEIWVLGDNGDHSIDSRRFGAIPADRFRGRVVYRFWPLSRAGPVR